MAPRNVPEIEALVGDLMRSVALAAKRAAFEELAKTLDAAMADRMRRRLFGDAAAVESTPAPAEAQQAKKGAKRPAAAIVDTTARLRAFIAEHPGLRVEQINRALGTTTRAVTLPLRKLVASGVLRTEGHKRSTTYYAVEGSSAPASRSPVAPRRRQRLATAGA